MNKKEEKVIYLSIFSLLLDIYDIETSIVLLYKFYKDFGGKKI